MTKPVKSALLICACFLLSATIGISAAIAQSGKATTFGLKPFTEKQTLRVGLFAGGPFSIPFYIADKEGFFKELNIDVVYETFDNGPAQMEANSTWDISNTGSGGILSGTLGYGVKMIGVGEYETNIALFARPGSALAKNPDDPDSWKGTTWLYPMGTTPQAVLAEALRRKGLSLTDVKSVNMDVASALTAFIGNQADGLGVYNTVALMADKKGMVRLGDAGTFGIVTPNGLMATQSAIEKKKGLITTAYALYYLTSAWIKSSPEHQAKAAEYLLKSSEDEGIAVNKDLTTRGMELFHPLSLRESIDEMVKTSPDPSGKYTARPISEAERKTLFVMMDFYISQKKYTTDDRAKILDKKLIDPVIALEAEKLMKDINLSSASK